MTIDVESFIRTGTLGDISLGMTRNDLLGVLGVPDAVAGGGPTPEILKYGDVEVMLKGGVTTFISIALPPTRSSDGAVPRLAADPRHHSVGVRILLASQSDRD